MHAPPDAEQLQPGSGRVGTLLRVGNEHHRCRDLRAALLRGELVPAYVEVAVLHWQAFPGKEAEMDGNGRRFADVQAERQEAAA